MVDLTPLLPILVLLSSTFFFNLRMSLRHRSRGKIGSMRTRERVESCVRKVGRGVIERSRKVGKNRESGWCERKLIWGVNAVISKLEEIAFGMLMGGTVGLGAHSFQRITEL